MADPLRLGAVILTGGTAARMDGVDKASVEVEGVTLLERALHATMAALDVVVVGEHVPTSRPATFTREDPPHGGPAAGLLAGLDRLRPDLDLVCALAVDMPRVEAGTVARLTWAVEGDPDADAACLVDAEGRRQPLAAVYRVAALQRARPADPQDEHGLAMHRLVGSLRLVEVPVVGDEARDVDTWQDLQRLRDRG
jgi:molybdopterin-guanine dinucleotide biosynthesis protein A